MKSWSYRQITEHTEKCIKEYMRDARNAPEDRASGNFAKWMWRNFASGAFYSWRQLTMGWQKDFDSDRLEALTAFEMDVLIDDGHVHTQPKVDCKKCHGIGSYIEGGEFKNCECCT